MLLIAELREWFILIKQSLLVILHRVSSWIVWLEVEFLLPSVRPLLIFQDFLLIFLYLSFFVLFSSGHSFEGFQNVLSVLLNASSMPGDFILIPCDWPHDHDPRWAPGHGSLKYGSVHDWLIWVEHGSNML